MASKPNAMSSCRSVTCTVIQNVECTELHIFHALRAIFDCLPDKTNFRPKFLIYIVWKQPNAIMQSFPTHRGGFATWYRIREGASEKSWTRTS